jgi:ABC-type amino acid transport substrate-binding protein
VVIPEATVTDAMTALARGRVAAVVHDRPILRYALSRSNPAGLVLASETYEPQSYGFAIARGSRQRARLDAALLGLREAGRVEALERRFLDAPDGE